ncbi:hypothetical protein JAO73_07545 [Hymenobacter sp. BT523]|uniref:hypothetical protein n=1 Tax=Hymenobacter sp. BT523 TaxID=2795725 RepID=UPI0018EDD22B|nr:hypothetical protein [Hymenobacter sp. BT523]MBJ6108856.1 hypothetical protein [Hymenobacter sp. BT523]
MTVGLQLERSNSAPAVAIRLANAGTSRLSYLVQYFYSTDGRAYHLLNGNVDHTGAVAHTPPCRTLKAKARAALAYPYRRFFALFPSEASFFKYAGANAVFVKASVKDCDNNQEYRSPPIRITNPASN